MAEDRESKDTDQGLLRFWRRKDLLCPILCMQVLRIPDHSPRTMVEGEGQEVLSTQYSRPKAERVDGFLGSGREDAPRDRRPRVRGPGDGDERADRVKVLTSRAQRRTPTGDWGCGNLGVLGLAGKKLPVKEAHDKLAYRA